MSFEPTRWSHWVQNTAKLLGGIVLTITWATVIYVAVDRFTNPEVYLATTPVQQVLSSSPSASNERPPNTPETSSRPMVSAQPNAPVIEVPNTPVPPSIPVSSDPTAVPKDARVAPNETAARTPQAILTMSPTSASRYVPRGFEVRNVEPGATFTLAYGSPAGLSLPLLNGSGTPVLIAADASGRLATTILPATQFAGLAKGPWTITACTTARPMCWTASLIISDGNAAVIGSSRPPRQP